MAARGQNVTVDSGDDYVLRITVMRRNATTKRLEPVNLVGATMTWVLNSASGNTRVVTHSTTNGHVSLEEGTIHVVRVEITGATDTASLAGPYRHELEVVDAEGLTGTPTKGTFTVIEDQAA